jgi:2-polyprenyl-3-methyl-5-hydroxy-6-metoxy-1,4-benzoquinol methylase
LGDKLYRELAYKTYISTHFSKLHRINQIDEEYEKTYFYWKEYICPHLPKNPKAKFLDIGCGLGHQLYALKTLGYPNVKGIDVSPECVEFCKSKGFDVEEANLFDFLERANLYNVIYASDVLEHFSKDEALRFVKMARRRLNKFGLLLFLIPNANNLSNFRLRYTDITHEMFYTPESIAQLLLFVGFENVKTVGLKHFSLHSKTMTRTLFKCFVAMPFYIFSEFLHKMFYLSQGLTDVTISAPKLLTIAVK